MKMDNLKCMDDIKSMSPETFQNKLWLWFKENGVISEIKAHMRKQMIRAIKNCNIVGEDIYSQKANINTNFESNNFKQDGKSAVNNTVLNGTKCVKNSSCDNEKDANYLIHQVYEDLKLEFNKEISIVKKEEQDKYDHLQGMLEEKFSTLLLKEKERYNRKEHTLKKKLRKELKKEHQRLLELENQREIENERNLQIDLEKERCKLMEECRRMTQNKNANNTSILEIQQRSFDIGLKAVQRQSNRLRKKEERLNRKLSNLAQNKIKQKHNSFQTTISNDEKYFRLQNKKDSPHNKTTQTDNNELHDMLIKDIKNVVETKCQTMLIEKKSIKCQTDNISKIEHFSKAVQSIHESNSIGCQTECFIVVNRSKNNSVTIEDSKLISDAMLSLKAKCDNLFLDNDYSSSSTEESSTSVAIVDLNKSITTDTLKEENTRLKLYNEQQRSYITQLLKQHIKLKEEVDKTNEKNHKLSEELSFLKFNQNVNNNHSNSNNFNKHENLSNKDHSDCEFETLKERIRELERESDENDKSYFEIKRQMESCTNKILISPKSSLSDVQSNAVNSPSMNVLSSGDFFKKTGARRRISNTYGVSNYCKAKNANCDQIYDLNSNKKTEIFQNYVTTSHDFSIFNAENPKLFADMLLQRNSFKNYNCEITDYSKLKMPENIFERYITNSNLNEKLKSAKQQITRKQKIKEASNKSKQHFILNYDLESNKKNCDQLNSGGPDFESMLKKNKDYKSFHYDMKKKEIIRRWSMPSPNKNISSKKSFNLGNLNQPIKEKIDRIIKFSNRKLFDESHNREKVSSLNESKENDNFIIDNQANGSITIDMNKIDTNFSTLVDAPKIVSSSSSSLLNDSIKIESLPFQIDTISQIDTNNEENNINTDIDKKESIISLNASPFENELNKTTMNAINLEKIDTTVGNVTKNDKDEGNYLENIPKSDLIILENDNITFMEIKKQLNDIVEPALNKYIDNNNLIESMKQNDKDYTSVYKKKDKISDDENPECTKFNSSKNLSESGAVSSPNTSFSMSVPNISDDNENFWE